MRHLCSLSQEGYLGMKPLKFFSSLREKFAAIKVQHQQHLTLVFGLWPSRNLDSGGKIYSGSCSKEVLAARKEG